MEEKENTDLGVNCPIHGTNSSAMRFTYNDRLWGKRMCFKCVAELVNEQVDKKQAEFVKDSE